MVFSCTKKKTNAHPGRPPKMFIKRGGVWGGALILGGWVPQNPSPLPSSKQSIFTVLSHFSTNSISPLVPNITHLYPNPQNNKHFCFMFAIAQACNHGHPCGSLPEWWLATSQTPSSRPLSSALVLCALLSVQNTEKFCCAMLQLLTHIPELIFHWREVWGPRAQVDVPKSGLRFPGIFDKFHFPSVENFLI